MGEFRGLFYCSFPYTSGLGQEWRCKKQPLNIGSLGAWELLSIILLFHYYHTILTVLAKKSAVISSGQILLIYGIDSWTQTLFWGTSGINNFKPCCYHPLPGFQMCACVCTLAPFHLCSTLVSSLCGKVYLRSLSKSAPFVSWATGKIECSCPEKAPDTY